MLRLTGFQALKELGIEMEVYCASEIDEQAMQVGSDILWWPCYPRGSNLVPTPPGEQEERTLGMWRREGLQ